jgi:N-acetylglutamate synthase-like GNAT family acetyltransferase
VTESTEHPLGVQHLAGCLALSQSANWNQSEADWRLMLEIGHGWGISLADGALVASTLVLPYGGNFAWVSMVLVLPEHRRMGYATRLLRVALNDLENRGLTPVLDATPAGREVYQHEGFRDRWGFSRLATKDVSPAPADGSVRTIRERDWAWILELDALAFGASRERLLRGLARRLPQAALVIQGKGFLLGRDGREAHQLGPLVARDEQTAMRLLSYALAAVQPPLYLDVVGQALREWLEARGFLFQRPFTRMVRGSGAAPGNEKLVFLVAGPELG